MMTDYYPRDRELGLWEVDGTIVLITRRYRPRRRWVYLLPWMAMVAGVFLLMLVLLL